MDLLDYLKISSKKKQEIRINSYLDSIKSTNPDTKNKYKMVHLSPLRYAGGKSRAIGHIIEYLPKNIENTIVSPFFGGGSFEFVASKKLGFKVLGYDIFDILVNYWNVQINEPEKLYQELKNLIPDKKNYTKNRHILLNYWEKVKPDTLEYETKKKFI